MENLENKKLLTKYEVAIHLFSKASKPSGQPMKQAINCYSQTVIDLWCGSFGEGYNMSKAAVKNHMMKLVLDYYNDVYNKAHRKKEKHHKGCLCPTCSSGRASIRRLEKAWRTTKNGLFDIGINMDKLEGEHKVFYEDQKSRRIGRLDKKIDKQYEEEQELLHKADQEKLQQEQAEEDFIMQPFDSEQHEFNEPMNSTISNSLDEHPSLNRLVFLS